jgi:mono/diheme cytochrome c family protein
VAGAVGLGALGISGLLNLNSSATAQQYVPTYYVDVQPILEKNCVSCHTTGGIAPFSLTTPEEAVKHAAQISAVVESGYMPPWPPGNDSPRFLNERKLGQASKQILVDWAKAGAPLGKK